MVHIFADDVVRVFFLLIDAVYRFVGPLLLVAAFLGSVLIDRRTND